MPTYKELLVIRDKYATSQELLVKVHRELSAHPETSGGEILCIESDIDAHQPALLVTAQYTPGDKVVQCTHRITIETVDVSRGTSPEGE